MTASYNTDVQRKWVQSFLVAALVVVFFAPAAGCQSLERKNETLALAQRRLLENPRDKAALTEIVDMLKTDSSIVARANAAATLGTVAEKHAAVISDVAVPALSEALDRDTAGVRDSAARALVKFGPHATQAVPSLIKNLRPSDTSVAWFSAEALGNMREGAKDAVPDLLAVVKETQSTCVDDSPHICHYAVVALGKIGTASRKVVPDLVSLLESKNPYFVARLATAILRIDPASEEAVRALQGLLTNGDVKIRRATIWSIEDLGGDAKPIKRLIEAAKDDSDESVRVAAAKLLKQIGN